MGGAIANAPVVDFAMDIVSIDGVPCAKRGKKSGTKQVWEVRDGRHVLLPSGHPGPEGGTPLISTFIRDGVVRNALPCLRPGIGLLNPCCSWKTRVPLNRAVGNSRNHQAPDKQFF